MPREKTRKRAAPARGKYDRGQTTAERREEQRRRLLTAAAEVFAAKGYANASVHDVCARAGMSRRTFYEHFEDLRDALLELHEDASNRAFSHVEERTRAAGDPIERLRAGIEAFLTLMADEAELARVLFREIRAAGPRFEARHEASQARYVALLFEGIADAYAKGVATRPPDELTIFALVSGMEAVAMRYLLRREEARAKQAAPVLVDLVLRAFR